MASRDPIKPNLLAYRGCAAKVRKLLLTGVDTIIDGTKATRSEIDGQMHDRYKRSIDIPDGPYVQNSNSLTNDFMQGLREYGEYGVSSGTK